MAANSKREQILKAVIARIEKLTWLKKADRKPPFFDFDRNQFFGIANTEMPYVGVIGQFPNPNPHIYTGKQGVADLYRSKLDVELHCVFIEKESPDSKISDYGDDVWYAIHQDLTWGKLAINTLIKPENMTLIITPYAGFFMRLEIEYIHKNRI